MNIGNNTTYIYEEENSILMNMNLTTNEPIDTTTQSTFYKNLFYLKRR